MLLLIEVVVFLTLTLSLCCIFLFILDWSSLIDGINFSLFERSGGSVVDCTLDY